MKKFLPALAFLAIFFFIPSISKAAQLSIYPTPVSVSIYKASSFTLKLNNAYQLTNNDTGSAAAIPAGTTLSVKNTGTQMTVSYPGFTQTSTGGFQVQELVNTTSSPSIGTINNGYSYRGSFNLNKSGSYVQVINTLDMENYLKGVVPSEMPASWPMEALKAQAIAARSYATNSKSLTNTPSSQVYGGFTAENPRSNAAVDATKGLLAKFAGKPIMAFFFSTSGGETANYADVWNPAYAKSYPYFVSVDDPFEVSPLSNWTETVPASAILTAFDFTNSSTKLLDISLKKTGANGEVSGVTVHTSSGDKTITGNEGTIRSLFPINKPSAYNELYSSLFTITAKNQVFHTSVQTSDGITTIADLNGQQVQTSAGQVGLDRSNVSVQTASGVVQSSDIGVPDEITSVTVSGKGFGHRIGMSQYGAKGYAEHGWTAVQIIEHYYPGVTVSQ